MDNMADAAGFEPAISSVTSSRGRPDSPTVHDATWWRARVLAPTGSAHEAVLRTGAPATHRDAESVREGKNSGLVLLRNLRDARASPLQR
jgi:hypothetical protein